LFIGQFSQAISKVLTCAALKPCFSTVKTYEPGSTLMKTKYQLALVSPSLVTFVPWLVNYTAAREMAPPELSVTVPLTSPVDVCARTTAPAANSTTSRIAVFFAIRMATP
jgi:hypothetical protein